ncbi:hypothetical protein N0V88_002582 [Collariella sp. IMI 366227]|nr:hypothetical protein N0V88_002582 [Collariella sp. IMI 366227]
MKKSLTTGKAQVGEDPFEDPNAPMGKFLADLRAAVPFRKPCDLVNQCIFDIFPEEIIGRILKFLLNPGFHIRHFNYGLHWSADNRDAPPDTARHLASAMLVCRAFYRLSVGHLYRHIFFYMPGHANRARLLWRTYMEHPEFVRYCRTAHVVRQPDPSDEWVSIGAGPGHMTWAEEEVSVKIKKEVQQVLTTLSGGGRLDSHKTRYV